MRKNPGRVLVALALGLALLIASAPLLRAQPAGKKPVASGSPAGSDRSLKLLQQARQRYAMVLFEESIQLLEQAKLATREPGQLGQIYLYLGINYAVMGKPDEARKEFSAALGYDPELTLDPQRLKQPIVEMFNKLRRGMSGQLVVGGTVKGVVHLDGKQVGKTPYTCKLPIGRHRVQVFGPGKQKHSEQAVVYRDRKTLVTTRFTPPPEPVMPPPPPPPVKKGRLWTYVAAGGAVVALGLGIGLGASASSDHSEYEDPATGEERGLELEDSIGTKSTVANVMFGVAGALAVTSVVLFFVEGRGASRERPAATASGLRLAPLVGQTSGLVLSTSF